MTEESDKTNSKEDSMSPPPDVEASQEGFYPTAPSDVENVLGQLVNLNDENILHESTCLICSSPYRKDIEDMWLAIKKHDDVEEDRIELLAEVKKHLPALAPPKKKAKTGAWPGPESSIIVDLAFARTLMPRQGCLRFDPSNQRYQVFYTRSCSQGFSLKLFEPRQALFNCLQFAWTAHVLTTGEQCTVEGLF